MHPKLAISYHNGLLELVVLDEPEIESTDYEIWAEVPKLNVSRAIADGEVIRKDQIVSFMAIRFHEDAPGIIQALDKVAAPSKYDVPELGMTHAPLREILQKVYQQYTRKKGSSATL
jgi:hypothetical protein